MKKQLKGVVVSNKMQKTVVVKVETIKKHPKYGKIFKFHKNFKAHTDEQLSVGDKVILEETRPMSKDKRWIVKEVLAGRAMDKDEENNSKT